MEALHASRSKKRSKRLDNELYMAILPREFIYLKKMERDSPILLKISISA